MCLTSLFRCGIVVRSNELGLGARDLRRGLTGKLDDGYLHTALTHGVKLLLGLLGLTVSVLEQGAKGPDGFFLVVKLRGLRGPRRVKFT